MNEGFKEETNYNLHDTCSNLLYTYKLNGIDDQHFDPITQHPFFLINACNNRLPKSIRGFHP